jgi:hypothetical protein
LYLSRIIPDQTIRSGATKVFGWLWSIQIFILPASRPALGISEIFRFTHEIYLVSSLHTGGHFQQEKQQKTEDMTNLESGCL